MVALSAPWSLIIVANSFYTLCEETKGCSDSLALLVREEATAKKTVSKKLADEH